MPNILNDTEEDIEYEMDEGRPDDDRTLILSAAIAARGKLFVNEDFLKVKVATHRFLDKETGELLKDFQVPIENDVVFK